METNFDYSSFFKKLEKLVSNDHVNSTLNENICEIYEAPSRLMLLKEMENVKNNKKIVTEM